MISRLYVMMMNSWVVISNGPAIWARGFSSEDRAMARSLTSTKSAKNLVLAFAVRQEQTATSAGYYGFVYGLCAKPSLRLVYFISKWCYSILVFISCFAIIYVTEEL